jgi:hypothetical protein
MFRPLTFVTLVMACGSGLYLYQVKHQAQVLDKQIERTVKAIDAARSQVRELSAEWTLEGNPERLQQLATQFLPNDRPIQPSQFVGLAELDARLPTPRPLDAEPTGPVPDSGPDAPPVGLPDSVPDAAASGGVTTQPMVVAPASAAPVKVPAPATAPIPAPAIAQARPAERKPADAPRPTRDVAAAPKPAPRPAPAPMVVASERPAPVPRAMPPVPAPVVGSMLGMAHGGTSLPPPRPMPVSTAPVAFGNQ